MAGKYMIGIDFAAGEDINTVAQTMAHQSLGGNFRLKNTSRRPIHRLRHALTARTIMRCKDELAQLEAESRRKADREKAALAKMELERLRAASRKGKQPR
jgi:hypothetical protein